MKIEENSFQDKKVEYREYFQDLWKDSKPLFKLYKTDKSGYLYDTGTNRIFACNDIVFGLLNNLAKDNIQDALDKTASVCSRNEFDKNLNLLKSVVTENNILKTKRSIRFDGSHFNDLGQGIQNEVEMIQLEVTERCNLRCAYCLYNQNYKEKRNHGQRDMTMDIAFSAVDHLKKSSGHRDDVGVTFYGGEPLLCFPLIKSCIQYAKSVLKGKKLNFSITTNGTLITPGMAKYLADEQVIMTVSIDGPQDVHDEHRKDINGCGSFQKALSGLKMLYEAYEANEAYDGEHSRISLSMVYTPPFSEQKISRMAEILDQYAWISRNNVARVSYAIGFNPFPERDKNQRELDISLFTWARNKFIKDYQKGIKPNPIASGLVEKDLARIIKRPIRSKPAEAYHLNGCCVPATRKQFMAVDGTLVLCEKMGMAPVIGNIKTGVDVKYLKDVYVDKYATESLSQCSECWAVQLCSICYLHAYREGIYDAQNKKSNCTLMLVNLINHLKLYSQLLEINDGGLDYLLKTEFR